jgi:uncharacterized protein (TIGR00730 family)
VGTEGGPSPRPRRRGPDALNGPDASTPPPAVAPASTKDLEFLEGPESRSIELARALRIFFEFLRGFRALHFVGPCVTVFGSARFPENDPWYGLGREVGRRLALAGFTVMTGGGPGIMEAANRGAKDVGGMSVGCNIQLHQEQFPNRYLDHWVMFQHFFVRKVMLVKYSYAFIAMPGGFGTMDEIFEAATLIQTGKIRNFPLVLMGEAYWRPLLDFLRKTMLVARTIDAADVDRILVTDSAEEAVEAVREAGQRQFGLKPGKRPRPRWFFLERFWQRHYRDV